MALLSAVLILSACSFGSVVEKMGQNLSLAILNQDDPQTVRDGAPAYLLLIDGLIQNDPENVDLLIGGAQLYGLYASVFVDDAQRASRLSTKALEFGQKAWCEELSKLCGIRKQSYEDFVASLGSLDASDVAILYLYGAVWAGWIRQHRGDWNAVADVPKVEAIMRRVVKLDESYDHGAAHIYLGVLSTLMPPALGGKPEEARRHFERAFELSGYHNLSAEVLLAERYARGIFDRPLHDRILRSVLAADAHAPGFTLMNILAQEQARKLLKSADDYF